MRRASRSIGAALVLGLAGSSAMALGFGRLANATVLGQPLSFSVALRFDADEYVGDECVAVEVWAGDNKLAPSSVRFRLDPSGEAGAPLLRVSTTSLIDEPVATLSVALGCPVRLTRKFVLFIDPPLVNLAQSAPAEAPAVPAGEAAAAPPPAEVVAPRPQRAAAPAATRAPSTAEARPRPRAVARAPSQHRAEAPAVRRRPEARVKAPAAPARTGGPRLQLEPAQALARPAPAASSALAAAPAAAAAPASAITVATAASIPAAPASAAAIAPIDNERLRQLEDSLTRLKADNAATRNDLAALQSRLREAEGGRYANPLVYLLAGLVALLLLVLAGVLAWARRRERERAEWWDHAAPSAAPSLHDNGEQSLPAVARSRPADPPVAESAAAQGWRHTVEIPELDAAEAPRRAVSAEELIDLEQQAEFFVTLGQDDAAVELLLNHIASVGGISPLPYLKLLEIHRHRGDREAYERVREQFNQRFNAYAPAWDDRDAPARSLEDDREVMARLQAAWPTPTRAMGVLEPLLFRQGASDAVFDLAAYREVLFLYEIARDLADRESRPTSVDLELPIGDAPSVVSYPLHTTMPITPAAGVARPLALDVNLDDAPEGAEQPNERSQRYEGGDFSFSSPAPLPGARGKPRPR